MPRDAFGRRGEAVARLRRIRASLASRGFCAGMIAFAIALMALDAF